jgi:hypothetical protein
MLYPHGGAKQVKNLGQMPFFPMVHQVLSERCIRIGSGIHGAIDIACRRHGSASIVLLAAFDSMRLLWHLTVVPSKHVFLVLIWAEWHRFCKRSFMSSVRTHVVKKSRKKAGRKETKVGRWWCSSSCVRHHYVTSIRRISCLAETNDLWIFGRDVQDEKDAMRRFFFVPAWGRRGLGGSLV